MTASVEPVIRLRGLTKRFGNLTAVDGLDLDVMPGEVFGFLGPNGAGKSTTIGMMLGLIRPLSGSVEIFGLDAENHRGNVLRRVGAIIEAPAFYPYLSGRDNLGILAKLDGELPASRIDEVFEIVGLGGRGNDKFKHYSTGMKQRLGLASVLLTEPDLIMLDEPTSGLDPSGARHIRQLIRQIAKEHGKTVFMSSHLLYEVEQICDRVAIIDNGRTVLQSSLEELLGETSGAYFEVDNPEIAISVLTEAKYEASAGSSDDTVVVNSEPEQVAELNALLVGAGVRVSGLGRRRPDLESVFLELTGGEEPPSLDDA